MAFRAKDGANNKILKEILSFPHSPRLLVLKQIYNTELSCVVFTGAKNHTN